MYSKLGNQITDIMHAFCDNDNSEDKSWKKRRTHLSIRIETKIKSKFEIGNSVISVSVGKDDAWYTFISSDSAMFSVILIDSKKKRGSYWNTLLQYKLSIIPILT